MAYYWPQYGVAIEVDDDPYLLPFDEEASPIRRSTTSPPMLSATPSRSRLSPTTSRVSTTSSSPTTLTSSSTRAA